MFILIIYSTPRSRVSKHFESRQPNSLLHTPSSCCEGTTTSHSASTPLLGFFTLEDGTDRLSRNVAKELPLLAA